MFSAWNQKPKQPNMPLHNVYSLPSIGRFVVKLAEKRQKTALKFQLRFWEGRFYPILDMKTVPERQTNVQKAPMKQYKIQNMKIFVWIILFKKQSKKSKKNIIRNFDFSKMVCVQHGTKSQSNPTCLNTMFIVCRIQAALW